MEENIKNPNTKWLVEKCDKSCDNSRCMCTTCETVRCYIADCRVLRDNNNQVFMRKIKSKCSSYKDFIDVMTGRESEESIKSIELELNITSK